GRPSSPAILFRLAKGERSHWHRIDAVEIWHYYAGAALRLSLVDGSKEEIFRLGGDVRAGEVAAGNRSRACLAGSGKPWRMDAPRLHGCARILFRWFLLG